MTGAGLRATLDAVEDVDAACSAVMQHLLAAGFDMPSLYLERGGRLRLQAQRGYWQVQDGFPTTAGIMGQVFTSGEPVQVRVEESPHYVEAATGVVDEVSVPIRLDGRVAGVLNVESRTGLAADTVRLLEQCAGEFAECLDRLGPPEDSSAHQLARHAVTLTGLQTESEIWQYAVEAGRGLSTMPAAVAVELSSSGRPRVVASVGPFGERLRRLPASAWIAITGWTSQGTSCYTVGDPKGSGFAGHEALRAVGVAAVIIVPVVVGERTRGMLVVADEAAAAPTTTMVARLELLSIGVGGCLARVAAVSQLHQQATRDALTNLPNRPSFLTELKQRLVAHRRRGRSDRLAVLFCDLDHFKDVNDSLGHASGDRLLIEVGRRLREAVRPSDMLARFGGDEFAVVCDHLADEEAAIAVGERLLASLAHPVRLDGAEVYVSASIGVAMGGTGAPGYAAATELLREADTAMYDAKRRGSSTVAVFCESLRTQATRRVATTAALSRAVEGGQLRLRYQPIVSLPSGQVVAAEALLRWRVDSGQLLSPGQFVEVAEDSGLIVEVGAWALHAACQQLAEWDAEATGPNVLQIAVNLSARQIAEPELADRVAEAIDAAGIAPHRLILEITESTLMDDIESATDLLAVLKGLGVQLAVDDFGTGFSSLTYLKRLPVDVLKIDRSFVSGLGVDSEDTGIVTAIVGLAQALDLDLIAEGVETADQRDRLVALGCRKAQGFLFARPVSAHQWPQAVAGVPNYSGARGWR